MGCADDHRCVVGAGDGDRHGGCVGGSVIVGSDQAVVEGEHIILGQEVEGLGCGIEAGGYHRTLGAAGHCNGRCRRCHAEHGCQRFKRWLR